MNVKVDLLKGFPDPENIHAAARVYAGQQSKSTLDKGYKQDALHVYTDEAGTPIYWKIRLKHPKTGDKWIRSFSQTATGFQFKEPDFKEGKKPLYNLYEVTINPDDVVVIVEGEKAADALADLGLTVTTSGGANSASGADWQPLARRKIIVWRDNDAAGIKYQDEVKAILLSLGCDISIVDIDALGLQSKGDDAVDWLAMRGESSTTSDDVFTLPFELCEQYARAGDTASDTGETDNALIIIEAALLLANDKDNPDAGALWAGDVIDALRHIYGNSRSDWARVRLQLRNCRAIKLSDLEAEILPNNADQNQLVSDASVLIALASEKCTFVHDEDLEAFAIVTKENIRQCMSLQSKSFNDWLSYEFYKSEGLAPSELSLKSAINSLSGKAKFEGDLVSVHVRVALHDGAYWVDLCNDAWQAVRITAQGWQVIENPPVLFTRSNSMRPLPTPTAGNGNLQALWAVANIPDIDRLFIITWLIECYRPETPYPVLELSGEQGSAKSSTQSAIKDLIDPNKSNLRTAPKNKDDIFISAKNGHLVSFENLSHLSADYQDALCVLATGGGYAGRTLYTNSDETVIDLKKPIVLNGIPAVITAQDLIDRSLHIDCPMLDNTISEVALNNYWIEHHAAVFTGLLDTFVLALAHLPQVDLEGEKLPRMADFTRLGEAVYVTHGKPAKTFLNEYRERRKEGVSRTLESSPIALAMIAYLECNPQGFVGTVKELLEALDHHREQGDTWVRSAKGLGDAIQRLKPAFRQIGIQLDKDEKRTMHGYRCTLKKEPVIYPQRAKDSKPSASSTLSTCEVHAADEKQTGNDVLAGDYVHHELHVHQKETFNTGGIYTPPNPNNLDLGEI